MRTAFIIFAALAFIIGAASTETRSDRLAATISSVMLQAMERGYQCHAAARQLADCLQEQRERWANPTNLPPFGSKP